MKFAATTSLLLVLGLAALLPTARADVFLRGDVTLVATDVYGAYELVAEVPAGVRTRGELVLPGGCVESRAQAFTTGQVSVFTWAFDCERHLGPGSRIELPLTLDAAAIRIDDGQGRSATVVTGRVAFDVAAPVQSERSVGAVAADYLGQGVHHIWVGWDHLAFVLCLCFVARRRLLLLLITAFTAGHSISMALSFLGVINVAVPPIEAIIALSIVWMARDALVMHRRLRGGEAVTSHAGRYFAVVSGFGLVHGLGFASALEELGVAVNERVAALAFFNIGVEVGQVLFVLCVSALLAALRRAELAVPATRFALYATGCIGSFWMIERIAGFGWA